MKKLAALIFLLASPLVAASRYAAPGSGGGCNPLVGYTSGTGTEACPWTWAKAISSASAGDTVYMRGLPSTAATFTGNQIIYLNGTAANPIVFRSYPGEWAHIEGIGTGDGTAIITVNGSYTWFEDFEISSPCTDRLSTQTTSWPTDMCEPDGFLIHQASGQGGHHKFINLIIHDVRQGISWWVEDVGGEINGCDIYYIGWEGPDRGHGHNIYSQNSPGNNKLLKDTFVHDGYQHNIQIYSGGADVMNNYDINNLMTWNAANLPNSGGGYALLLGGYGVPSHNNTIHNVRSYGTGNINLGYEAGGVGWIIQNNYIDNDVNFIGPTTISAMNGGTYIGAISPSSIKTSWPSNTYLSAEPTSGTNVFVTANDYEAGRGQVVIYNWASASTVAVDLSTVLTSGSTFAVYNASNPLGNAVVTGTYNGSNVTFPMTTGGGLTMPAPIGIGSTPAGPWPKFAAFIVKTTAFSGGNTPTPTFTSTVTNTPSRTPTLTSTVTLTPSQTPTAPGPTSTFTNTPTLTQTFTPSKTPTPSPTPAINTNSFSVSSTGCVATYPMTITADPAAFGGFYAASLQQYNGKLSCTFNVPQSGDYRVWTYIYGLDSSHDSFYLDVDGDSGVSGLTDGDTTNPHVFDMAERLQDCTVCQYEAHWNTWNWNLLNDRSQVCGSCSGVGSERHLNPLSAGDHTISFRERDPDSRIAWVIVTNDPNFNPTFSPPPPTDTPTLTPTPPTQTPTNTQTPSNTATRTPTFTPSNTATFTPSRTPTPTSTGTLTPSNTATDTPTKTNTPVNTPVVGTATQTPTVTPTPSGVCRKWCKCNHKQGWVLVPCGKINYNCKPCPFH